MKRLAALTLTLAVTVGVASPAGAHSFGAQGPTHSHQPCNGADCRRWILANGAIIQGPSSLLAQQQGYVLVLCSFGTTASGDNPYNEGWQYSTTPYGPWGNVGQQHTYCRNPQYPTAIGSAGWSVNA